MGREKWKCWMRDLCERMECRLSVVMKIGDVVVLPRFVSVLFAGLGVDAMDSFRWLWKFGAGSGEEKVEIGNSYSRPRLSF